VLSEGLNLSTVINDAGKFIKVTENQFVALKMALILTKGMYLACNNSTGIYFHNKLIINAINFKSAII